MNRTTNRTWASLTVSGLLLCVGYANVAGAQAVEPAGVIQSIAIDDHQPANVFAAGNGRVYGSSDNGRSWAESDDTVLAWSLAVQHVDIVGDPAGVSYVYAGTQDNGVMRSTDGGASWVADPSVTGEIRTVAVVPYGNAVWAGSETALYVSRDHGESWSTVTQDVGVGFVHGIAFDPVDPNNLYVARWNQGIFASIDGGQTWTQSDSGMTDFQIFDLDVDPFNPGVLYASTTSGVFQSVDAGSNWSLLPGQTLVNELTINDRIPGYLFVATENEGLYRSTDGGQTWQNARPDGVTAFVSVASTVDSTLLVYAGSVNDGLFVSDNGGVSWVTASEFSAIEPPPVNPPSGGGSGSGAALSISVADLQGGEGVPAGGSARFRVSIRNEGPDVATQVAFEAYWVQLHTFSDNVPEPFTITAAQGSCPTTYDCFFGDLPVGAERTIEFSGSTEAGSLTRYRLYARASADNAGQVQQTAEISALVTVFSSDSSGGAGASGYIMLAALLLILLGRCGYRRTRRTNPAIRKPKNASPANSASQ